MKKNLIMGTARGYSWFVLEPFVRSFLKNVPSADLVLFVDEISDFTKNYINSTGGASNLNLSLKNQQMNFLQMHAGKYF